MPKRNDARSHRCLPYKIRKDRIKDLATYAVSRTNLRSTQGLVSSESPRVRFTGIKPDFNTELGLSFGDYVEAYDPKAAGKSNDGMTPRTEPCIALYPLANRNGSWVFYNLKSKTYVRRTRWQKLPTTKIIIDIMNALAGEDALTQADLNTGVYGGEDDSQDAMEEQEDTHVPKGGTLGIPTAEEEAICDDILSELPELVAPDDDDDSDSESEDTDSIVSNDEGDELEEILQEATDSNEGSSRVQQQPSVPVRRTTRHNAGVRRLDESYEWNLMNLSLGAAIRNFGDAARDACKAELQ